MNRNFLIDFLKLVFAVFIVGLHGGFLTDINFNLSYYLNQGIFRMGVPFFLIVSGYYFFEIKDKIKLKKWLIRLLLLYIIWMLIYSPYWISTSLLDNTKYLLLGYKHLWYLISAWLAFIIVWITRKHSKIQIILLILTAISGVLLQYVINYHITLYIQDLKIYYYKNALFFGLPFILTGYLINRYRIKIKLKFLIILLITAILIMYYEVNFNLINNNGIFDILISLYLITPLLFILSIQISFKLKSKTLSYYSTGIYLTHMGVLQLISNLFESQKTLIVLLTIMISFFLTFILIKINNKIKIIL